MPSDSPMGVRDDYYDPPEEPEPCPACEVPKGQHCKGRDINCECCRCTPGLEED